jgi:hypothetical protein
MEYVAQRGSFDDVPLEQMVADFAAQYPMWRPDLETGEFDVDVARETGR